MLTDNFLGNFLLIVNADGKYLGFEKRDIDVAEIDVAGLRPTPGDNPVRLADDRGGGHCKFTQSQSTILAYSAAPPGPTSRALRNPWIKFVAQW